MTIINIRWEGPFSLSAMADFGNVRRDYGLYQIYAHHPIYGASVLVYIGLASKQTFARRVAQHDWASGSEPDPTRIQVYLGRLTGSPTPPPDEWHTQIAKAEKLLIHSHAPAYNTQQIKELRGQDLGPVRILNWGSVRSLHREVSGLMWTSEALALRDAAYFEET